MPTPFINESFTFTNPDGSTVQVVGSGNQFYAHFETEDGYTVVKDPQSGYYCYAATTSDDEPLQSSGRRVGEVSPKKLGLEKHLKPARNVTRSLATKALVDSGFSTRWQQRRAERKALTLRSLEGGLMAEPLSAPTVGNYKGLCILIEFPDVAPTISRAEVDNFCNKTGYSGFGNNGSVKDYFQFNSRNKLTYTNVVTQYYRAAHNRSYYTDPGVAFGTRARQLITEALDHLKAQGFNFSQLTADSSGYIYALNVFYVGDRVNNWSEGLWPHQWSLASPYNVGGSKKFSDYQITNMGSALTLRTFCHENGHMICNFPDLYDYGYESYGVGNYCLMCYGGNDKNPVQIGAYLKNTAGWATKLETITPGITATLNAANNDFYIHKKNATEYFIVENRQKTGRDSFLPDSGLAIWHIDETGNNSNEQMTPAKHYLCSIEQADNKFDLEKKVNGGDANDLYVSGNSFSDTTSPNSKWWDNSNSGLHISNISASGAVMTFKALGTAGWVFNKKVIQVSGNDSPVWSHVIIEGFPGWRRIEPLSADGVTNVLIILTEAHHQNKPVNVYFTETGQVRSVYL